MTQSPHMQLKTSTILNVPLQYFGDDFLFLVNGKEFQTKRLIADLLSKKICQLHIADPTIDRYSINTEEKGDFSRILSLINFTENNVPESEIPFFIEVIDTLENDFIEISEQDKTTEITLDNVFSKIQKHEHHSTYYLKSFNKEIEFISSHFCELKEEGKNELFKLKFSTLYSIFTNKQLKLRDEDQLFQIINELYSRNSNYSILYETINFLNVSNESICEFASKFDMNDLTHEIWHQICERLTKTISQQKNNQKSSGKVFKYSSDQPFSGIIDHIMQKSNGNIDNEIELTASSYFSNEEKYKIRNIALFDEPNKGFATKSEQNSWICINFKDHQIIPTEYTIKSIGSYFSGSRYSPKSWVIETSNDNISWETIDEVKNNSQLKGDLLVHTFKVQKQQNKAVKYIRMRSTDKDWVTYIIWL